MPAKESERLELDLGMHNCDGCGASGGPWITSEKLMKIIFHNEIIANVGEYTQLQLPQHGIRENYYKKIAVLVYPYFRN